MAEQNTNTGITELSPADVAGLKVSELANRPTNSSGYGSHGLSAAEVKARMDGYPEAIRLKLNALIGLFNTAKIPITLTWGTGASSTPIETLDELVALIQKPDFADNLFIHDDATPTPNKVTLKYYIQQYRNETATSADKAEGYAVGKQNGTDVTSGSPYYENNAKYYAAAAGSSASSAASSATSAANAKNDAVTAKNSAESAKNAAEDSAKESEGYAKGTQDGYDVEPDSPYYQKNAKYYSESAASSATGANNSAVAAFTGADYATRYGTGYKFVANPHDVPSWLTVSADVSKFAVARNYVIGSTRFTFTDNAWYPDPTNYGVTISGQPREDDTFTVSFAKGSLLSSDLGYHDNARYYSAHPADNSVGTSTIQNKAVTEAKLSDAVNTTISSKLASKPDGTNNLIVNYKLNTQYIPDSILGQVEYQGTFNAATGEASPTFTDSMRRKGNYWICFAAGSKNPDGTATGSSFTGSGYEVGDWAILNPSLLGSSLSWQKVDNTDAVTMVNGHKGAVNTYVGEATIGSTYNAGDTVLYGGNLYLVTTQFTFNGSNFLPNVKRYGLSDAEVEAIRDQIPADVLSEKIKGSDIIHANLSEDETEVHIHFDIAEAQNGQVPVYNNGHVHWGNGGGSVDSRQNIPVRYTFVNCGLAEGDTSLYIVAGTQLIVKLQAEEGYALPNEAETSSGLTATIDTATGEMTVTCNNTASAVEAVTVTAIVPSLDTFLLTSNNENLLDADDKYLVF